jgi:hypothetical protein
MQIKKSRPRHIDGCGYCRNVPRTLADIYLGLFDLTAPQQANTNQVSFHEHKRNEAAWQNSLFSLGITAKDTTGLTAVWTCYRATGQVPPMRAAHECPISGRCGGDVF